jgi:hypothetical protein
MTSRGIRSNNPGNIDRNATKWQGMAADQSSDPRFIVFTDPKWGIRAIARLMLTYSNQYGLHTVRGLIGRWAPPSENNTGAYVAAVAQNCGVGADDEIDVDSSAIMLPLVKAIILHENGSNPYPDSVIAEGIRLAGVADAPPPKLATQHTFQAQVGAGVAVLGAGGAQVAQYAPTVKGWADQLADYTGSSVVQHAVTVLLTVAGGLTLVGIAAQFLKQRAS